MMISMTIYFSKKRPCYTPEDAMKRNRKMEQGFEVCGKNNVEINAVMIISKKP